MSASQARFEIIADDKTDAGFRSAIRNSREFGRELNTLTRGAKLLTAGLGGFSLARFIGEGLKASEASKGAVQALDRLGATASASRAAFAEQLAPAIESTANLLADALPAAVDGLRSGFDGLRSGLLEFVADGSDALGKFYDVIAAPAWGDLELTYREAAKSARGFADEIRDLQSVYKDEAASRPKLAPIARQAADKPAASRRQSLATLREVDITGPGTSRLFGSAQTLDEYVADLRDAKETVDALLSASESGIRDSVEQSLAGISDDLDLLAGKSMAATDSMSEYAKSAAQNMQSAFAQFLFDPFEGGVRGMAKGFVDTLRQMSAEVAALKVFDWLDSKAGTGGVAGFLGGLFGGFKASGGPLEQGKWYIAGERGPEPIWGGGPGAFAMGYGSGGGAPVVNVTTNIDARGATRELVDRLPGILNQRDRALEYKIVDGLRRGAYAGVGR